ncbi:hypothetical protein F5Y04DRAFT_279464 [Hypomontagnella monticulosa]|nr:hypothetical protein F5Y04DRAFT_279464 [Hypomontagnella monticulosa]
MAQPQDPNSDELAGPATPGPTTNVKPDSHKYAYPQRSSLRRAVKDSLRDSPATLTLQTPPSTPLPSPSTASHDARHGRRSSLRLALRQSLHGSDAVASVATPPSTPSPVPATPTTPSTPAFATPTRRSARLLSQKKSQCQLRTSLDSSHSNGSNEDSQELNETEADVPEPNVNGIPTSRKGWYRVREIFAEARDRNGKLIYFVVWEGIDPRTGFSWPGSWVDAKKVSATAIREFKEKQSEK